MARAYVSSRAVVFVLTLLAFLYVDFEYLQMHPSPGLIAYINRITGVVTSATPPPQARPTMTAAEIEQAHQKLPKGLGDGGGGRAATHSVEGALGPAGRPGHDGGRHLTMKRHFDAAPQGAATALESPPSDATPAEVASEASPQPNYRLVRFNAKSHMAFPIDLFLDYSTARWLAVDVGIANIPFVTANLISAIHPLVAFFAAYLIVKAASSGKNPGQGSTGASAPIELSHIAAPHSPVAGAHTGPGVSPSNHTGEATPKTNTTAAMVAAAAAATVIEDETKPLVDRRAARQMSAVNIAEADDAEKDKDWTQLFASVNQRSLRVAAALVLLRNILDTMDGIVARTQRANAIARGIHLPPAVTTVGFNGHTMDMVTDTLGCVAVGFAVHYVICTKTLTWHRIPAAIFKRIAPRLVGNRNQFIVKVIAWFGLSYIAVASSTWETFMIRYSNLFDVHANTNTDIFLLESNWHVRMTQMLWSLSCGDAMIFAVIIMLFFNKMWEGAQLMLLVGFPWQALLMGYSFWVWQNVILANATAAKIVLANPELFP